MGQCARSCPRPGPTGVRGRWPRFPQAPLPAGFATDRCAIRSTAPASPGLHASGPLPGTPPQRGRSSRSCGLRRRQPARQGEPGRTPRAQWLRPMMRGAPPVSGHENPKGIACGSRRRTRCAPARLPAAGEVSSPPAVHRACDFSQCPSPSSFDSVRSFECSRRAGRSALGRHRVRGPAVAARMEPASAEQHRAPQAAPRFAEPASSRYPADHLGPALAHRPCSRGCRASSGHVGCVGSALGDPARPRRAARRHCPPERTAHRTPPARSRGSRARDGPTTTPMCLITPSRSRRRIPFHHLRLGASGPVRHHRVGARGERQSVADDLHQAPVGRIERRMPQGRARSRQCGTPGRQPAPRGISDADVVVPLQAQVEHLEAGAPANVGEGLVELSPASGAASSNQRLNSCSRS